MQDCVISDDHSIFLDVQSTDITIWNTTISGDLTLFPHTSATVINPDIGGRIIVDHDNATLTTLYTVNFYDLPEGSVIHGNGSGIYEPGEYEYQIICPGYYDLNGSFNITDSPMELRPDMTPLPPPNEPPIAIAGDNRTVTLGYDLLITASQSHDDKGIDNYAWIWAENGTEIHEKWFIHHCDKVGNHTITLWVWDIEGLSDTDNMTINVYDPTPPPPINDTDPIINDTDPPINDTDPIPPMNDTEPIPPSTINDTEPIPPSHKQNVTFIDNIDPILPPPSQSHSDKQSQNYGIWIGIGILLILPMIAVGLLYLLRRKRDTATPSPSHVIIPDDVISPKH